MPKAGQKQFARHFILILLLAASAGWLLETLIDVAIAKGTFTERIFTTEHEELAERICLLLIILLVGLYADFLLRRHHRTELSLRSALDRLEMAQYAINSAAVPIIWLESDGKIIYANDAMGRLLGYTTEELTAMTIFDIDPTIDKSQWSPRWQRIKTEKTARLETKHKRKDGSLVSVEVTVNQFEYGDRELHMDLVQDISERLRVQDEMRNLAKFAAENPNPVIRISAQGVIIFANPASRDLLEEYKTGVNQPAPNDIVEIVHKALESGRQQIHQLSFRGRILSFRVVPLREEDYCNLYGRDVTEQVQTRTQLEASEHRFKYIVENAPDAIAIFDKKMKYLAVSKRYLRDFGLESDIIGKEFRDVFPDLPRKWRSVVTACLTGSSYNSDEDTLTLPDGTEQFVRWQCSPWHDEAGGIAGIIQYIEIITERKKAQDALNLTQFAVQHAMDMIIALDKDANILLVNESACYKLGVSRDELLKMNIFDVDVAFVRAKWPDFWQTLRLKGSQTLETRLRRRDGTIFPVEVTANYLEYGGREYCFSFIRDVTDRKRAEGEIFERSRQLRILLNAAQTLNAVLDVNHILRELTSRARELANAAGGTAGLVESGKLIFREYNYLGQVRPISLEFKPGEGVPGFVFQTTKPYFSNNAETDPHLKPELRKEFGFYDLINIPILSRSGMLIADVELHNSKERRGFSERDFPMLQGLADIAAVAIENAMLLEQRRSAEFESERANRELDSKNKELESIIYVASHDLRSALVNVQGFSKELSMSCETLRSELAEIKLPPQAREDVAHTIEQDIPESLTFILDSTGTIDSLLSGLLRLSRIGREPITIADIDMNVLISQALKSLEFKITQARARVEVENLPPCRGDWAQLTTVFTNLLDNAIKFLDPDRQGHIKISGKIDNGSVLYCVEDNGIGIASEHQSRIFEVFHRLYPERTVGEGLGLTIARRIIERHNGRIWVESQPGNGSKFFVLLPGAGNV